jgi:hypothetical protein
MNDFTKDELEEIAFNLGEIKAWSDTLENSWPLLDKIQSMIDDFDHECKHELTMTDTFIKCASCKKNLGYG